jgi:DNA polymerase III subunit delta'
MTVWERLRGSRAAEGLERQVRAGEVAHSWLFIGPRGSGKGDAARALAAAVNCTRMRGVGCGECSSCDRIGRQGHPDVHHVVPEGPLIPVDVVREFIVPEASRSPFEGGMKVFVIEEAERMNDAAQNALLKTLEEPQADTVFVLISSDESGLLETIVSRCRVVRFEPVPEADVQKILEAEGTNEKSARLAARLSRGDIGWARSFVVDSTIAERRRTWADIPTGLGSPLDAFEVASGIIDGARAAAKAREGDQKKELRALADAMGEGRGTAAARNALSKRHKRELRRLEEGVLGEALVFLAGFYRDVVAARHGAHDAVVNLDLASEIEGWARMGVTDESLLAASDRCLRAQESLAVNANVPLAIEAALLDVVRLLPPAARDSAVLAPSQ